MRKYNPIRVYLCEYQLINENKRLFDYHFFVKAYTKKQARIAIYHEIENRIRLDHNSAVADYQGEYNFIAKFPKIKKIKIFWEKDLTMN